MDSLRAFDEQPDYGVAEDDGGIEVPPEIGLDERRMHVRAYNYWVSLLDGRAYPSISALDPEALGDFGPNSVLLDFSDGSDDPKVAWLGDALREECDLLGDVRRISEVPKRSLLSRLTDHYMQIIANKAPIGFEAEFVGQRGKNTMYRGILMPFSSTGEAIDFIYGVINWKEIADSATASAIAQQASTALASAAQPGASPVWADGPNAEPLELDTPAEPALGRARARSRRRPRRPSRDRPRQRRRRPRRRPAQPRRPLPGARPRLRFRPRRRSGSRGLCRAARGCRPQGPGAGADDSGRQARLRQRIRQGAPHRIRRRSELGAPPGPSRPAPFASGSRARASRPSSRPNAAPAAPNRSRIPARPPARRFAPPVRSAMSTFPARRSSSSSSPAATKSAGSRCSRRSRTKRCSSARSGRPRPKPTVAGEGGDPVIRPATGVGPDLRRRTRA